LVILQIERRSEHRAAAAALREGEAVMP